MSPTVRRDEFSESSFLKGEKEAAAKQTFITILNI